MGLRLLKGSKGKEAALKGWVPAVVRHTAQGSPTKERKLKLTGLSSTNCTQFANMQKGGVFSLGVH